MSLAYRLTKDDISEEINELSEIAIHKPFEIINIYREVLTLNLQEWHTKQIIDRVINSIFFDSKPLNILHLHELLKIDCKFFDLRKYAFLSVQKLDTMELIRIIGQTIEDKELQKFNQLLVHELVIQKDITWSNNSNIVNKIYEQIDEFRLIPLHLFEIEKSFRHKSISKYGGSYEILFGLQDELKDITKINEIQILINESSQLVKQIRVFPYDIFCVTTFGAIVSQHDIDENFAIDLISAINDKIIFDKPCNLTKFAYKPIDATKAVEYIFNLCMLEGAYGNGFWGATSRLYLWRILSGLMQIQFDSTTVQELINLLKDYEFIEFSCDWFINEWFDLGLILVNKQTGQFGVMAATDTD